MGKQTGISWTDHTFSPWWGCVRVSPGCKHCYAAELADTRGRALQGLPKRQPGDRELWGPAASRYFVTAAWNDPPKWNRAAQKAGKPAFVFCASMADIFEDVPEHVREQTEAARLRLWELIDATPWLVWLLLTKRPERVAETVPAAWMSGAWPSNAWIGCTVEDQEHAEKRLPHLLDVPAPRRFVSYEPALGPVDWENALYVIDRNGEPSGPRCKRNGDPAIDWIIIGGESGTRARPFRVEWARDTIRQCKEAGVAVWMKQMGAKSLWPVPCIGDGGEPFEGLAPGHFRDRAGADPAEWPDDLRVHQRPEPATPKS